MTKHRIVLSDFKDKKRDEGAIEIEAEDGNVYRIDPPDLWPDDIAVLASDNDSIGMARALLGDRYDAFIAAGGSANIVAAIVEDVHNLTTGESSASSSS